MKKTTSHRLLWVAVVLLSLTVAVLLWHLGRNYADRVMAESEVEALYMNRDAALTCDVDGAIGCLEYITLPYSPGQHSRSPLRVLVTHVSRDVSAQIMEDLRARTGEEIDTPEQWFAWRKQRETINGEGSNKPNGE